MSCKFTEDRAQCLIFSSEVIENIRLKFRKPAFQYPGNGSYIFRFLAKVMIRFKIAKENEFNSEILVFPRPAELTSANLSGAVINENTNCFQPNGCVKGVNGIYVKETDSAALMTLIPPGDSMKGAIASAVIESLKQARSLHVFSMTLSAFVFYLAVLQPKDIKLPLIGESISASHFGLFAMPFSIGFLLLTCTFMSDALSGAKYFQTRDDAMAVGQFPWALSRYIGRDWPHKILSFLIRFVMAFHAMVFLYFRFGNHWQHRMWLLWVFIAVLFVLSLWIFNISQQFQRPILFDRKTEEARKAEVGNLVKLAKALDDNTAALNKLIEKLEPKNVNMSGDDDSESEPEE